MAILGAGAGSTTPKGSNGFFATVSPARILAPSKAGPEILTGTPATLFPKSWPKSVWNEIRRSLRSRREERPSKQKWWIRGGTGALSEGIRQFDRVPRLRRFGSAVLFTKGLTLAHCQRARSTGKSTAERRPLSRGTQAKILPRFPDTLGLSASGLIALLKCTLADKPPVQQIASSSV
jgi:hypothetical protein